MYDKRFIYLAAIIVLVGMINKWALTDSFRGTLNMSHNVAIAIIVLLASIPTYRKFTDTKVIFFSNRGFVKLDLDKIDSIEYVNPKNILGFKSFYLIKYQGKRIVPTLISQKFLIELQHRTGKKFTIPTDKKIKTQLSIRTKIAIFNLLIMIALMIYFQDILSTKFIIGGIATFLLLTFIMIYFKKN